MSSSRILQVMATDADSYANSVITYSIIDGNPSGNFLIGPQDGVIQISNLLDRESVSLSLGCSLHLLHMLYLCLFVVIVSIMCF